jgi:hypothetical protein
MFVGKNIDSMVWDYFLKVNLIIVLFVIGTVALNAMRQGSTRINDF